MTGSSSNTFIVKYIGSTHRLFEGDFNFLRFEPNLAIFFFKNCVRMQEGLKKLESF